MNFSKEKKAQQYCISKLLSTETKSTHVKYQANCCWLKTKLCHTHTHTHAPLALMYNFIRVQHFRITFMMDTRIRPKHGVNNIFSSSKTTKELNIVCK